ncbi:MAG: HD domain-containing protein [Pseudomonadota bacterium]
MMDRVSFTEMQKGVANDYRLIAENDQRLRDDLAARILDHLALSAVYDRPFKVNRLQHMLQTADRARAMGADDDWVFAALLHDIGDILATDNHAAIAADILAPLVRPEVTETVRRHELFQFYYYNGRPDIDRNARERFRGQTFFECAVVFCHLWDQKSFDPDYPTSTLHEYKDLVIRICQRESYKQKETFGLERMGLGPTELDAVRGVL